MALHGGVRRRMAVCTGVGLEAPGDPIRNRRAGPYTSSFLHLNLRRMLPFVAAVPEPIEVTLLRNSELKM